MGIMPDAGAYLDLAWWADFASIIWLDVVLSGDNALIIGLAASSLPPHMRRIAIVAGLALAAILRILFATMATYLMSVPGLLFCGGLALLWVSWRLFSEIRKTFHGPKDGDGGAAAHVAPQTTVRAALISILVADVSMSIDNVLAVAAIARHDIFLLIFGLGLSIILMGFFATLIVKFLTRFPWISYLGVVFLVYISGEMLWDGWPSMYGLLSRMIGGITGGV